MNLFFQILSLQLLILCKNDQEFAANLDYVIFSFVTSSQIIIFVLFYYIITFKFFSIARFLLATYAYASFEPIDYIILSSFELKEILLIFSSKNYDFYF